MKLKFWQKVFLTFLFNSLMIVICMLVAARYYAHRNFEDYIGKVEMERLDELAAAVSEAYLESKSWDPIIGNWDRLINAIVHRPLHRPQPFGMHSPPNRLKFEKLSPQELFGDPPFPQPPGPPMGPPPLSFFARVALFDASKKPLLPGDFSSLEEFNMKPIRVQGNVIGWVGIKRLDRLTHPLELEFIRRLSVTLYAVGGVGIALAVLVTFFLSRQILLPLQKLAEGTRALTSRKFETRIEVRSHDEFGQLTAGFNEMAKAMERYEQLRRQWIVDISHELRTPLAILRGEIESMQDGVRQITPEALDSLHFEVLHVGRIVHDLHDLSLIESQSFEHDGEPIDPCEVLSDTLDSFTTRFEQRGIGIKVDGPAATRVTILADARRLRQLYSNLLENTLRYANTPGTLRIFRIRTQGQITLRFEDTGPGVPKESLMRLFDRLYRVDKARSRAQGGSGLGLAICKSIAELFHGSIEAYSAPSGGLGIALRFPLVSLLKR